MIAELSERNNGRALIWFRKDLRLQDNPCLEAALKAKKEISVECAVLIPDLTRHFDVVEVISPTFLREHMDLKDGDEVELVLDSN